MPSQWSDDLALAQSIADEADELSRSRFRAVDLDVRTKADLTPVTDADRGVERLVRERLATQRPHDAVLGEEEGQVPADGARRWIVDPIDGTKNYARGVPVWATLLALEVAGEVVLGVVSAPALHRRWWAARGDGAWSQDSAGPRRMSVSAVGDLDKASLSYSSLVGWRESGRLPGFLALSDRCWRTRAYGDFWSYMLVAEGGVDIAVEPEVSSWDLAALDIIVREAGGHFTNLAGEAGPHGGSAVATNGALHRAVLDLLA